MFDYKALLSLAFTYCSYFHNAVADSMICGYCILLPLSPSLEKPSILRYSNSVHSAKPLRTKCWPWSDTHSLPQLNLTATLVASKPLLHASAVMQPIITHLFCSINIFDDLNCFQTARYPIMSYSQFLACH